MLIISLAILKTVCCAVGLFQISEQEWIPNRLMDKDLHNDVLEVVTPNPNRNWINTKHRNKDKAESG